MTRHRAAWWAVVAGLVVLVWVWTWDRPERANLARDASPTMATQAPPQTVATITVPPPATTAAGKLVTTATPPPAQLPDLSCIDRGDCPGEPSTLAATGLSLLVIVGVGLITAGMGMILYDFTRSRYGGDLWTDDRTSTRTRTSPTSGGGVSSPPTARSSPTAKPTATAPTPSARREPSNA